MFVRDFLRESSEQSRDSLPLAPVARNTRCATGGEQQEVANG